MDVSLQRAVFTPFKDCACLLIKDIFSPVCGYAGYVDLNKSY